MQAKAFDSVNLVVIHPGKAIAIRAGNKESVECRNEDRALNGKLEATSGEEIVQHPSDTEPVPKPAKQQWTTDALGAHGESHRHCLRRGR